ncbi:hypothetical protein [Streptomyces sp. NPDC058240]|uniref:hypothetical protein n=1 Tax=Streptomyces sp. NPDC058240 TaxID=3346396 RepID=UPI0036F04100
MYLTDLSWSLLIGSARRPPDAPAGLARHLRRQARLLVSRRLRDPRLLPELSPPSVAARTGVVPGAGPEPDLTGPVRPPGAPPKCAPPSW